MAAAITGDRTRTDTASARTGAPPELAVRLVSALLAPAGAAVHVETYQGSTQARDPPPQLPRRPGHVSPAVPPV